MIKEINWGIIGLGKISGRFATDLLLVDDANLYAVASRSQEKADTFKQKFNADKAYDSYDQLFKDPKVDIVYIGTPHNLHAELSIMAMNHGKHVLCEKPIALNESQTLQMIETSKKKQVFFMEALWSRFNPSIVSVIQQIEEGAIGELRYINADFSFYAEVFEGSRLTNLALGGGSLLDIGIYPLFLSYVLLGIPDKILAASNFYDTGADKQTSIILHYNNAQAVLHSNVVSFPNITATLNGTTGKIVLSDVWHEAQSYTLVKDGETEHFSLPTLGKGFTHEIMECHNCLRNESIESDLWSHQDSINLMKIMDQVRQKIGLKFPIE